MHEPYDHRLHKNSVRLLGKQAYPAFDILVIRKVDLLRKVETFFHTDTKICDSLHHFPLLPITNGELWQPNTVNKFFCIFYNIVEDEVKEDEELHPHQFIMLSIGHKHLDFRVLGV
jgi:hypothetical protein